MGARPRVLFVCVGNAGKSQMAAGLLSDHVGDAAEVSSAGTEARAALNALSVRSLAEVGIDITDQRPEQLTDEAVRAADLVVVLGSDARVDEVEGTRVTRWVTDEPSERGIEGIERMRLVRDDIAARVRQLASDLAIAPRGDQLMPG
ncbi:arsenate-mycothiol transferase ArsC [Geodermatophilus chilensis]|uniref:arsenate-mycothiol transferase ArsC n=1 Tax=Geodermatophilus chilensis TaxID=2035835 RepID=UPI000C25B814|nr:low molecular weight phosphatase family protein [Geodermatophilus chilensis]